MRVPAAGPGDLDALEHGLELRGIPALPRGDHDRQRFVPLLAGQVYLAGQPAAGTAQAVIGRLVIGAAGRLGLQIPLFRAPAARWCARATAGIHGHIPGDQPRRIRPARQRGHDPPPGAIPLPSAEQPEHPLPRTVPARDIPPRRAGADPRPDPVDQLLFRPPHRPARLLPPRRQRLRHHPLRTGQVGTAAHRYGRHEVSVKMVFLIAGSSPTGDLTASSAQGAARGLVTGPPGSGTRTVPRRHGDGMAGRVSGHGSSFTSRQTGSSATVVRRPRSRTGLRVLLLEGLVLLGHAGVLRQAVVAQRSPG